MNRSLALLILVPVLAASACSSDDGGGSDATKPATDVSVTDDSVTSGSGADAAVTIAGFKFIDVSVTIAVGDSVTWTNNDDQAHTATSSGNFDAGAIDPSKSSTIEFPTAGTFTYICAFHPFMSGTVVVE